MIRKQTKELRDRAISLKMSGLSYNKITKALNVSYRLALLLVRADPAIRRAVFLRARGQCEICHTVPRQPQYHHRTIHCSPAIFNTTDNLLFVCASCHRRIESEDYAKFAPRLNENERQKLANVPYRRAKLTT